MKPFLDGEKNTFLRAMQRLQGPRQTLPPDWPTSFLIGALLGAAMLLIGSLWWF